MASALIVVGSVRVPGGAATEAGVPLESGRTGPGLLGSCALAQDDEGKRTDAERGENSLCALPWSVSLRKAGSKAGAVKGGGARLGGGVWTTEGEEEVLSIDGYS